MVPEMTIIETVSKVSQQLSLLNTAKEKQSAIR